MKAMAASSPKSELKPFEADLGELPADEVEIEVQSCGICHSDLSMLDNDWGMTTYPFVPGHEIVGKIAAIGSQVKTLTVGQQVGVGWTARSCLSCTQCMSGDQNLCPTSQATMIGRFGGFADRVRCQAAWTIPIPAGVALEKAGPLFCGGITVFNPMVQFDVQPTDRVGVIGIGGLGHMAIRFLKAWGCDVTAFTSSDAKKDEALKLGAHNVVSSKDTNALKKIQGSLQFIISTVNVPMEWEAFLSALSPKGRLHIVGAVLEPIPVNAFSLIMAQKSISGSPIGAPVVMSKMIEFCARHKIEPVTEHFPMSKVNEALEHLRAGKARYRIVLKNDL